MVYCVAYNCYSDSSKGDKNIHWFIFPKDERRQVWTHYCKRQGFIPSKHSRLCSKHFTESQYSRYPPRLAELGYPGANAKLKDDAIPDVPIQVDEQEPTPSKKVRTAFEKRRKQEILQEALDESATLDPESDDHEDTVEDTVQEVHVEMKNDIGTNTDEPKMKSTKQQVDDTLIRMKTRRVQTVKIPRKSVGIQCVLIGTELEDLHAEQVACLDHTEYPPKDACTADDEGDDDDEDSISDDGNDSDDPDYSFHESDDEDDEESDDDQETQNYMLQETDVPTEEKYYMVAESSLRQLLGVCRTCMSPCRSVIEYSKGTMICTSSVCTAGHIYKWQSQKSHERLPWGNLTLASAIMISGNNTAKTLRLFDQIKLKGISESTARRLQCGYTLPAVLREFDSKQADLVRSLRGQEIVLGGDGRCDSPGYSAKYGSYTLMDLDSNKILDIQLVQSNEVRGSTHMELEGLKRGLTYLIDQQHLDVSTLVTDRHVMIKKYMREQRPDVKHYFDVWHIAKGISKKLETRAKKKGAESIREWIKSITNHTYWVAATSGDDTDLKIAKWKSISNHIANVHEHDSDIFPRCSHGDLEEEREWLQRGSRPYKLVLEVVESSYLLRDLGKLSPVHQTYGLEVFHSVINQFAPKSTHFFHYAMQARLYIAALHFNENGNREQDRTREGELKWRKSYPRAKKGDQCIVKPQRVKQTYEYVDDLLSRVFNLRAIEPSVKRAIIDFRETYDAQPTLTSGYQQVDKAFLIRQRNSRFRH